MIIQSTALFKLLQKFPWLSKAITISNGYNPDNDSDKDYWFGAEKIDKEVLCGDGQWNKYLPDEEIQKGRYFDSMGCTGYGFNNILEMIAKRKWESKWNKSDRYVNKMTGTTPRGNSMRKVMDITRKYRGLVNESSWPWNKETFNWGKYYDNIPKNIQELGQDFLKEYEIKYERVGLNKNLMMTALKYSPLYVAGYAWYNKNGLYRSYGRANHAFTVVGYVEGSHWLAFDSYSPYIKKLDWNFLFGACYILTLDKKNKKYNQTHINKLRERGFKYVMRTDKVNGGKGEIYELTDNGLKELTTQDKINEAVREMANKKDLTGISELDYGRLIK